ncbi:MAG: sugar ABC transporter substrate-binding protein [Actinocatenispora sp.]
MRFWRKLVVLASACLLVAGCGSGGGSGSEDDGHLTWFMWTGSQEEVAAWKHVAGLVTKKYPDIHISFTTTSFGDYFTKLKAEAASDSLPCLISLQSQHAAGFGELFEPLGPYLKGSDGQGFDDTIMSGLKTGGAQRALPYDYGPYLLYYNKDMFAAAGAKQPTPDWTMDDFTAAMKKLGPKGLAAFPYPDSWLPFAVNEGHQYVSDSGQLQLTDPGVVKSFGWYSDLVHKYHYAPQVPATKDLTWPTSQFQAGNAAMAMDGPWDLINTKNSVKFTFGLAPIPSVDGTSTTLVAGSGFGMSKSCPAKDSAAKAIKVMTGPGAEKYLAEQGRAFPARVDQQKYWYSNAVPGSKPALDAALKNAQPFRTTGSWDEVGQLMTQYGVPALNGAKSPGQALRSVQSQAAH